MILFKVMKNRYILLIVSLLCCLNVLGQRGGDGTASDYLCSSGVIANNNSSSSQIPGPTKIYRVWNSGHEYASRFIMPTDDNPATFSLKNGDDNVRWGTQFTEEEFINLTEFKINRSKFEARGEQFDDRNGGKGNTVHSIKFKSLVLSERVEWSYNKKDWHCNNNYLEKIPTVLTKNPEQYYTKLWFDEVSCELLTESLWMEVKKDSTGAYKEYEKNGTITLYLRFVFHFNLTYQENRHGQPVEKYQGFFHPVDEKNCWIVINRCELGDLKVKSKNVPVINGDSANGFAIYEKESSDIVISSDVWQSKNSVVYDYDKLTGRRIIPNENTKVGSEKDHEIDDAITKAWLTNGSTKLIPGKEYVFERKVENNGKVSCESGNKLKFTVFPEPKLKGFDKEKSLKIYCPRKGSMITEQDVSSLTDEEIILLKGNECEFVDNSGNSYEKYKSTYGAEYGWRYWTDTNNEHKDVKIRDGKYQIISPDEMFDYDKDNNGPDLYFPIYALEPGVTYYFEQYVKMRNFSDAVVQATVGDINQTIGYYEVRLSKALEEDSLKLDISVKEACKGEDLENVVFEGEYGDAEKYFNYGLAKREDLIYVMSIDGKEVSRDWQMARYEADYRNVQEGHCFKVSLSDGCGNTIEKSECIEVNGIPELKAENIITQRADVSVTYDTDELTKEKCVIVKGINGSYYDLLVTDTDKNYHNYYYADNDKGNNRTWVTYYNESVKTKTLYFYKENKNGYKCLSKPVKVNVVALSEITGNEFKENIKRIYICRNSNVPMLDADVISDPTQIDGVTYKYKWMYSYDNSTWKEMRSTDSNGNESFYTNKIYDGTWKGNFGEYDKFYIRRDVTGFLSDGTELGTHKSNVLTVMPYSSPEPAISLNGSSETMQVCYGEEVKLKLSVKGELLTQQQLMKENFGNSAKCITKYGFYDYDGMKAIYTGLRETESSDMQTLDLPVEKKYVLYSGVEYCGSMVYSKTGVTVNAYDKIDVEPILGSCKIVGNEITVTAVKDGHTCEITQDGKTFAPENGKSVATILLKDKTEYKYEVAVKNNKTGCQVVLNKSISQDSIQVRKPSIAIGPSGKVSDTLVCAGNEITIGSTKDPGYYSYSWMVDGLPVTAQTSKDYKVTLSEPGKRYEIKRIGEYYDGLDLCYTKEDVVYISTRPQLEVPSISLSSEKICNGDSVVVTATPNGGGKDTYYLTLFNGDKGVKSNEVGKGTSVKFTTTKLYGDTTFKVTVTDKECSKSAVYSAISEIKKLTVEDDLSFNIVSAHNELISDDFKNGKVAISTTLENVAKGEKITYTLKGGTATTKPVEVEYAGAMTISVDSSLFNETRNVVLTVVRKGTKVGDCESSASYTFTLNEGFSGTPLVKTDKGVSSEIELCGGKEVTLEVTNAKLITFAEKSILTMTNPAWQWYDGDSPIENNNEDGSKFTVKAESGRTHVYSVLFSAEDAGGMTRKIISNSFVVRGSSGVNVGRIYFNEYKEQTYVEHCVESDKTVLMSCDVKTKSGLQWYYSIDNGGKWDPVTNVMNNQQEPTSQNASIKLSVLSSMMKDDNGKLKNDKAYFRLGAEDTCSSSGAMTYSDNLLLVRFKTDVELPSVTVASGVVFKSETQIPDSITFSRFYRHTEPYIFVNRETADLGGSQQRVAFKDSVALRFGQNNVDILRSEKAQITGEVCMSDTLHYAFNIFKELKTPSLSTSDKIYCPTDGETKYLSLSGISGGVPGDSTGSNYKTEWQYKTETGDWTLMQGGDNMSVFKAEIKPIKKDGEVYEQKVHVTDLTETINVRVLLSCGGGYPGGYVTSEEVKIKVYAPLKDNGIDFSTKEICFNTAPDTIKGYEAEGGSGRYSYTWWKSEDNKSFTQIDKGEEWEPYFKVKGFRLTNDTYIKRKVTDKVCPQNSLESEVKTISVKESFSIKAEDVEYSRIVTNKAKAEFTGLTDFNNSGTDEVQYVWYKNEITAFEQSAVGQTVRSEGLSVKGGDYMMVTYYAEAVKDGCKSYNKIPMEIFVYNQIGGNIAIDYQDESKDEKYWICSGESDIQIISSSYAGASQNMTWYYTFDGVKNYPITEIEGNRQGAVVTTPEIRLDTTNMVLSPFPLKNNNPGEKKVKIFRVTTFTVESEVIDLYSDTVTIYIVPTLEQLSDAYLGDKNALAGTIELRNGKSQYCMGEAAEPVLGGLDKNVSDIWNEYRSFIGPWIYNSKIKGGFTTHYEYSKNGGEWISSVSYDYSDQYHFAGMDEYYVPSTMTELDGSYKVRRVMDDGCTSITSNEVFLSLYDKAVNPDTVKTYAFTPETTNRISQNAAIKQGYEIGDSIVFTSYDMEASNLVWFSDIYCTDTLMDGNRYCSLVLTDSMANMKSTQGAYIYAKAKRGNCLGELVAIPFEYGSRSNGGKIGIVDSIICYGDNYSNIVNVREADGYYIAPKNVAMKWTYGWQYKRSESDRAIWSNIEGAVGQDLSEQVVNGLVAMSVTEDSPLVIRRVATNEKGRVRYSNPITLLHYDRLVPGELSLNNSKSKYCVYDDMGYVKASPSTGGSSKGRHGMSWRYNINGTGWNEIMADDSLYLGYITEELKDRTVNNVVNFKCLYYDMCDTVESNNLEVTFYRRNEVPSFYQNNDSCNASVIKLVVSKEEHEKTYFWSALYIDEVDGELVEKQVWNYVGEDCMVVMNGMVTSQYGVWSEDKETGCLSDYYYFKVDSLPGLQQEKPQVPTSICLGSDLEAKGGKITGGNGARSFQWQISTTGLENDFVDIMDANEENLHLQGRYMKTASYIRRIIVDMCDSDTSEVALVNVREKVGVSKEDIEMNDFKCENTIFTSRIVAIADSVSASEYWVLNGADTFSVAGKDYQMEGFAGDSAEYTFVHYVTDTLGLTCPSDEITVYAHNKPSIDKEKNVIDTDDVTPCDESYIVIEGGAQNSSHIRYSWYINGEEQFGSNEPNLKTRANGLMSIVRVMDNGCVSDTSRTLTVAGRPVYDYDYEKALSMEVVSDQKDSSVVVNILGSKKFSDTYYFMGDGVMPYVQTNNILLPYKSELYKDSVIEINAHLEYCVRPYSLKPLAGGVVSFDGSTELCGGNDVSPIVVTELVGGKGDYKYQWQYRNERTPDFINIDGATDKSYTPKSIDVETVYRRITTDGIYKSVSNELTLKIRPLPSVRPVTANIGADSLDALGLSYKEGLFYEWTSNIEMVLKDSAENADGTYWQKSYNQNEWIVCERNSDSMAIADTAISVYYRFIAESACGSDTSGSVLVTRMVMSAIADEDIHWNVTDTFACANSSQKYMRFRLTNKAIGYMYSYRVESACNLKVTSVTNPDVKEDDLLEYYSSISISEVDEHGAKKMPSSDVTLFVTRHDTTYGLSLTRKILMRVDALDVTYTMSVENGPEIRVGEKNSVELKQGDRVKFIPSVTSGGANLTYKWVLEEPVNADFFSIHGGRNGMEGLTSAKESPSCYYYNGGSYPVTLYVTDGLCEATVRDTSLYISSNNLRRYSVSMSLEEDGREGGTGSVTEYVEVYPTLVDDYLNVRTNGENGHEVYLVDELGRVLYSDKFIGYVRIPMGGYERAAYFVVIDNGGWFKVIKK